MEQESNKSSNFFRLYLQSQRRLYAYILMLVPNCSDADDILQQTSSIMWEKFDTFEPGSNFGAWAVQIAKFLIMDHFKKQKRSRVIFKDSLLETFAESAIDFTRNIDKRLAFLRKCVEKLSFGDRNLIAERYERGQKIKDIAEKSNRSVHGLYKTINRIHHSLLNCVRRHMLAEERI